MEEKKPKTTYSLLSSTSLKVKDNKPQKKKEVVKRGGSLNYNQHDFLRHPSAHNLNKLDEEDIEVDVQTHPQTFNNVNIIFALPEDEEDIPISLPLTSQNTKMTIGKETNKPSLPASSKRADSTPKVIKSNSLSLAFSPQQKILDEKITNSIRKGCDYDQIETTFSLYHKFKE